jgi:four helix bundle protein
LWKRQLEQIRNPNTEILNKFQTSKQKKMSETEKAKRYDLEDRTFAFAEKVRSLVEKAPKTISNIEDCKQLVRSSGSVGANYIEANEALSKKDFVMRIKICRKEAKESAFWLRLLRVESGSKLDDERDCLVQEARELTSIFGAILRKSE